MNSITRNIDTKSFNIAAMCGLESLAKQEHLPTLEFDASTSAIAREAQVIRWNKYFKGFSGKGMYVEDCDYQTSDVVRFVIFADTAFVSSYEEALECVEAVACDASPLE